MAKKRFKPRPKKQIELNGVDIDKNIRILIIVLVLVFVSGFLIGFSQLFYTTSIESEITLRGFKVRAGLKAELSQSSLDYELNFNKTGIDNKTEDDGGGLFGGFGDSALFGNRSKKVLFLEGLEDFQEQIGILLNSYKDKYYTISADTSGIGDLSQLTKVNISTHVGLIPWWPTGINQDFKIRVEVAQKGAAQKIIVEQVQIQLWRKLDDNGLSYREGRVVLSKTPGTELSVEGQSKVFEYTFALGEYDDVVGLLGYVKLTFIDSNGSPVDENLVSNIAEPDPETNEIPLSITTNIRVLNTEETTKLAMLMLSFPLSIISLILVIVSSLLLFIFFNRPKTLMKIAIIIIIAAIIQIIASAFLFIGVENLVNIIDSVLKVDLRENYVWNNTVYMIYIPGILLLFAGLILLIFLRTPKPVESDVKPDETFQVILQ